MSLNSDDREYIEDWNVRRKSKKKFLIGGGLYYGVSVGVLAPFLGLFDSQMVFHPEEFNLWFALLNLAVLTLFGCLISLFIFTYKERKYQKILKKRSD